ncbi:MAG: hypothetical protein D6E12_01515 [Desulfovibrio sp.]|mgnify:CR=1 FL=1|nr:MAG: hypothetical protein D6E12_01515 [Desulfovibrio sp.]
MAHPMRPEHKVFLALGAITIMTLFIAVLNLSSLVFLKDTALNAHQDQMLVLSEQEDGPGSAQVEEMQAEFSSHLDSVLGQAKTMLLLSCAVTVALAACIAIFIARSLRRTPAPGGHNADDAAGAGSA